MTCAPPIADAADSAVDRAQLHLALASVSYMSGQVARSRAEAEAVLAEPGLPAALYAAAEQSHLLALLADGSTPAIGHPGTPAALVARAALAWRGGCVGETLEMLSAAACAEEGGQRQGCYPSLGLAAVYAGLGQFETPRHACSPQLTRSPSAPTRCGRPRRPCSRPASNWPPAGSTRRGLWRSPAWRPPASSAHRRSLRSGTTCSWRSRCAAASWARPIACTHSGGPSPSPPDCRSALPTATGRPYDCARRKEIRCSATKRAATRSTCSPPTSRCSWSNPPRPPGWSASALRAGDDRRVREVTLTAERLAAANPRYPTVAAAAAHARGIADGDAEKLAAAVEGQRAPWARASAAEDCAVVQAQRGDRAAARSWLERAAEDYLRCGATRDHARIRSRLRHLGVRRRHWSRQQRPVSGWESLTETENAVAALVAEGLSNQQVASRMFLSRHTVDFHLRHIFRKLGIDSRVVLTRIALAHTTSNRHEVRPCQLDSCRHPVVVGLPGLPGVRPS